MGLHIENLYAGYGPIEILHGVCIRAEDSRITCIIGPNGAGKSTVLRAIYGIIKPRRGEIVFDGERICGLEPHVILRKGISYILQGRSIFPQMTVWENLQMGAYIRADREQVARDMEEVYEKFPVLREKRTSPAYILSGGEQRMLELGRALMVHPKILLIDEPSIGLAPRFANAIYEKIRELNREKVTILIVEQNVRKALSMADYAYVLDLGQNRFEGPARELLDSKEIVKLYVGASR